MAEKDAVEPREDAGGHYEAERRETHLVRPGFRINELVLGPAQSVPWHSHSHVSDTFYVLDGRLRLFLRDPTAEVGLGRGESFVVAPGRPHLVTGDGGSVNFLVLQGIGTYDYVPLRGQEPE